MPMLTTENVASPPVPRPGAVGQPDQAADLGDRQQDEHGKPDDGRCHGHHALGEVALGKARHAAEVGDGLRRRAVDVQLVLGLIGGELALPLLIGLLEPVSQRARL